MPLRPMTPPEAKAFLAARAENARTIANQNQSRTYTHKQAWELISYIITDLSANIQHTHE